MSTRINLKRVHATSVFSDGSRVYYADSTQGVRYVLVKEDTWRMIMDTFRRLEKVFGPWPGFVSAKNSLQQPQPKSTSELEEIEL